MLQKEKNENSKVYLDYVNPTANINSISIQRSKTHLHAKGFP